MARRYDVLTYDTLSFIDNTEVPWLSDDGIMVCPEMSYYGGVVHKAFGSRVGCPLVGIFSRSFFPGNAVAASLLVRAGALARLAPSLAEVSTPCEACSDSRHCQS